MAPRTVLAQEFVNAVRNNQQNECLSGVVVEGNVDLSAIDCNHKLTVHSTIFKGHFNISEAHFSRSLDLRNCAFEQNVNFSEARIDGSLILTHATIQSPHTQESANFERIYVHGNLNAKALQANVSLNFKYCQVSGKLSFASTKQRRSIIKGDLDLNGAKVSDQLDFSGSYISGRLILQESEIQGDLFCNLEEGFCTETLDAWLLGIKVSGRADLSGIKITKDLCLEAAEIQGALDCKPEKDPYTQKWHYTKIGGNVNLGGAKVLLLANFSAAEIGGDLSLEAAEIRGNFFCKPEQGRCTTVGGDVNLVGVYMLGWIDLNGIRIRKSLTLKRAEIRGKLDCERMGIYRPEIGGDVILAGAKILGSASFSGAKISGDLVVKGVEIRGSLNCQEKTSQTEKAILVFRYKWYIKIQNTQPLKPEELDLWFISLVYHHIFWRTEISGRVNLTRAKISSSVDFRGAHIGQDLSLEGAELSSAFYCELNNIGKEANFQSCSIHSLSILIQRSSNLPNLNLSLAKVVKLEIKNKPGTDSFLPSRHDIEEFNMDGLEFQQIKLPDVEKNKYIKILETANPFPKNTYLFMEKWLRNQSAQIDGNRVYTAMRRRDMRERVSVELGKSGGLRGQISYWNWWLSDWILDWTIGYGTSTNRLIFYFLAVLMISWGLFCNSKSVERQVLTTINDIRSPKIVNTQTHQFNEQPQIYPSRWTKTDAFWLALQMNLPLASFASSNRWTPSSDTITIAGKKICLMGNKFCPTYENYASAVSLQSWIIVPLFLAGVSGIVKKEE